MMIERIEQTLNLKQRKVRRFNAKYRPEILICEGAVGSGKTVIELWCFLEHLYRDRDNSHDYIMTGYTLPSLERNILKPLKDMFGLDCSLDRDNSFECYGNRVNCFGTDNQESYRNMRGIMRAYGHYANEITLSHKNSIDEALKRCRGEGARFFYETNPEGPQHYIYKNFIERAHNEGNNNKLASFNFNIYDNDKEHNGYLPDDYIKRLEESFTGILKRKYLMGEWCAIEGQLYFPEQLLYYDDDVFKKQPLWNYGIIINGYLDPAAGSQKKTGCYTSFLTGCLKNGNIYLLDAFVRKAGIPEMKLAVKEKLSKYNYSQLAYEDNFGQELYVGRALKEDNPFAPIVGLSSREDKLSRLVGMHGIVTKKVYFPQRWLTERNSDGWLLIQQLANITKDRNSSAESPEEFMDAPDALEGLIRTFRTISGGISIVSGREELEYTRKW